MCQGTGHDSGRLPPDHDARFEASSMRSLDAELGRLMSNENLQSTDRLAYIHASAFEAGLRGLGSVARVVDDPPHGPLPRRRIYLAVDNHYATVSVVAEEDRP